MIVNQRIVEYINSIEPNNSSYLMELEKVAIETKVPIIKKETQSLLKTIITIKQPMSILEIGTAIGFSSILMSEYIPEGGKITTIERNQGRIEKAKYFLQNSGKSNIITLLEGDAQEVLEGLQANYDFIFMDSAKAQYIVFLPHILRLLNSGGILITDNVLQGGEVVESRYGIVRRNRTIHNRMREYLWTLKHQEELTTTILSIGDGVTISVKK